MEEIFLSIRIATGKTQRSEGLPQRRMQLADWAKPKKWEINKLQEIRGLIKFSIRILDFTISLTKRLKSLPNLQSFEILSIFVKPIELWKSWNFSIICIIFIYPFHIGISLQIQRLVDVRKKIETISTSLSYYKY